MHNISKSVFFCIVLMVMTMQVHAQGVGINTTGAAPDSSAMLDIAGTNRGFLLPRFNLSTASFTPVRPQSYLMVFDTVGTINAGSRFNTGRGLYFNAGTPAAPSWRRFLTSADSTLFWGLRGNSIPDTTNYIGTSNAQNLSIRTNGVERIQVQTPVSGNPTEVVILNATNLRVPIGTASTPSLRFTNTTLGMFGLNLSTPSVTGIGMGVGTQAYIYFTNTGTSYTNGTYGIRIRRNAASSGAEALPESSVLDVEGNIFTRGKLVYNELADGSQKTFLNEIHWNGTIPSGNDSPQLLTEGNTLTIVVWRQAVDTYFLRIATSTNRTFTCIDQASGQIVNVNPLGGGLAPANRVPINFTNDIPAGNGVRTIFIKEPATPSVTYQVTLLVLNNVTTVMIKRFQN